MKPISLQVTIYNLQIEGILRGIIGIIETIFPERIRGYYLLGSYANDTAVATSDLDITVLFKGHINEEVKEMVWDIGDYASQFAPVFLDLNPIGEDQLADASDEGFQLKSCSLLLFGEDVRATIPVITIDAYIQQRMQAAYHFIVRLARNQEQVILPLDFPDPAQEFYGYENDPIEYSQDTKLLVAIVSHIASALIAWQAAVYVPTKKDVIPLYRQHINDEWLALIEDVFQLCRQQWEYRLPESEPERKKLRYLCQQLLAFENHFLKIYNSSQ